MNFRLKIANMYNTTWMSKWWHINWVNKTFKYSLQTYPVGNVERFLGLHYIENLWKLKEKIRSRGQSKEGHQVDAHSLERVKMTTSVLSGNVITAGEAQEGRDRSGRVETQLKCSLKRCLRASVPVQLTVLYYWRPATLGGFYHRTLAAKTPTTSVWSCKKAFRVTDILSLHHSVSHPFPLRDGPLIFFLHKSVKPH